MVNNVILIGNLGGDPECKELEGGIKVARMSIATNENYKDKNGEWQTQTEWHNVIAWRGAAEIAEKHLKKGHLVYIEAKLSYRNYEDEQGIKRYATDVTVRKIRKLTKSENSNFIPSEPPVELLRNK